MYDCLPAGNVVDVGEPSGRSFVCQGPHIEEPAPNQRPPDAEHPLDVGSSHVCNVQQLTLPGGSVKCSAVGSVTEVGKPSGEIFVCQGPPSRDLDERSPGDEVSMEGEQAFVTRQEMSSEDLTSHTSVGVVAEVGVPSGSSYISHKQSDVGYVNLTNIRGIAAAQTKSKDLTSSITPAKIVDREPPLENIFRCRPIVEVEASDESNCPTVCNEAAATAGESPDVTAAVEVESWDVEMLRKAQLEDADIGFLVSRKEASEAKPEWRDVQARSETLRVYWSQWESLELQSGILYRKFWRTDGVVAYYQFIVPHKLKDNVIRAAHTGMTGGHFGISKTKEQVQRRAYWHTWQNDVRSYCRRCDICARVLRGKTPKLGPLQSFVAGAPWDRIHIDLTGPHPRSRRGNQYILTCVDAFTKFALGIAIRDKTAHSVARALVEQVFSVFGIPLIIVSDLGREFENQTLSEICRLMGIRKLRTTSYKPSSNGIAERVHRTLNSALAKVVCESQKDWCERLPYVMAAYRASQHASTNFSPNFLTFGREVRAPIDLVLGKPEEATQTTDDYAAELVERQRSSYKLVREHLGRTAERAKRYYDVGVKQTTFQIGQQVYYYCPRRRIGRSPKWSRFYSGPYVVEKILSPVNYVIRRNPRTQPVIVHVDKLKPYLGDSPPVSASANDSTLGEDNLPFRSPTTHSRRSHVVVDDCAEAVCNRPRRSTREIRLPVRYRQMDIIE